MWTLGLENFGLHSGRSDRTVGFSKGGERVAKREFRYLCFSVVQWIQALGR